MKKTFLWLAPACIVSVLIVLAFSHIYQNTQKLKSQTETSLYPEIDLAIIPSVSKAIETMTVSPSKKTLTPSEINQREMALKKLALKFPNAHALYVNQCLSCHGTIAQGEKPLKSFSTRMNHRESFYAAPPLLSNSISLNINEFFKAASKEDQPHLPRTLLAIDKKEILELQAYLKELVR
ncbi:MAG: hypothetical protein HYY62_06610 [Deltaproteobacteria bacterium]|nr:hypothetical protein [Deltaproteobacteria bacterium]